jgi:hypothetical protein
MIDVRDMLVELVERYLAGTIDRETFDREAAAIVARIHADERRKAIRTAIHDHATI